MMPSFFRATSCACTSVRRASRAISHLYDQVLVPTQLKSTQYMILRAIHERGEIAHCDLARELGASVETLSRRLAGARRAGLLQVHTGSKNRRVYSLTSQGKLVLEEATLYWENAQRRLQHSLGDRDWGLLAEFNDRLAAAALRAESLAVANGAAHAGIAQTMDGSCYSNAFIKTSQASEK